MRPDDWTGMVASSSLAWSIAWGVSLMNSSPWIFVGGLIFLFAFLLFARKCLSEPEENLTVTLRHEPPTKISLNGGEIRLLFDYRNNRETGKIKMLHYNTYVLFNGNLLQDSLLRDNLQIVVPPKFSDTYKGWKKKEMPGCYGMTVPGTYTFILVILYAVGEKTFTAHDIHRVEVVP